MAKQTKQPTKNQPDFNAFVVTKKDDDKKGFWTKIGAAWAHDDGKGFNLQLAALPVDGAIVLRVPMPDDDK
jgi:hypothetical protein